MTTVDVNLTAVVVAGVVNMIIGSVWYSKLLFAKQWMKGIGKTEAQIKQGSNPSMYAYMFVGALVMAYVLAHFVGYAHATTTMDGAITGFWAWLGFVATTFLGLKVFEGRSWNLYWINVGYYLVALMSMGAILAVWH